MTKPNIYLFDFANVVSKSQDLELLKGMSEMASVEHSLFVQNYWSHREAFDLGQDSQSYWEKVCGRFLRTELVLKLDELDAQSWLRINPKIENALKVLRRKNKKVSMLSNLPHPLISSLRQNQSLLKNFDNLFFSAEIGLVKPDEEIFDHVVLKLGVWTCEILFIDDRIENIDAAKKMGFQTFHFSETSQDEFLKLVDDQSFDFHPKSYGFRW